MSSTASVRERNQVGDAGLMLKAAEKECLFRPAGGETSLEGTGDSGGLVKHLANHNSIWAPKWLRKCLTNPPLSPSSPLIEGKVA